MNFRRTKLLFIGLALLCFSSAALAQRWPEPAQTPNTDVLCNTNACTEAQQGKKLVGYPAALGKFHGRYLDSVATGDYLFNFRTARARGLRIDPDLGRIYVAIGSGVAAYDLNTFFSRLAAGESMMKATEIKVNGGNPRNGASEYFLTWDRYFYPEWPPNGYEKKWVIVGGDGQYRLFGFDNDDRGYVYMAYDSYGWGIAKDDLKSDSTGAGKLMPSVFQTLRCRTNPLPSDCEGVPSPYDPNKDVASPLQILVTKASTGRYYAIISGPGKDGGANVYDVTNPGRPVRVADYIGAIGGNPKAPVIQNFAKGDGGRRIGIIYTNGRVHIHSNDTAKDIFSPLFEANGYYDITTDGTNFYASSKDSSNRLVISVFSPSGGTYSETRHTTNAVIFGTGAKIHYGGGFLTASYFDTAFSNQPNIALFKFAGGVPTQILLDNYFAKHYTQSAPAGYVWPSSYALLLGGADTGNYGAHVYKAGSKFYMLLDVWSIGDVYELKGADSIDGSLKKKFRTKNPFSKGSDTTTYYGNELTFTSSSSAATAPSVTWDFGDGATQTTPSSSPDIVHQYGSLAAGQLPKSYVVRASNAGDSQMYDDVNVTLEKPAVRVAVRNTNFLFDAASLNQSLPIVSSDSFADASDGAMEGHFAEWKRDTDAASIKTVPDEVFPVGGVGQRTLTFKGHYGPYTGSGESLGTIGTPATFTLGPISYTVYPFVALVNGPTASGSNVVFKNGTRITTNTVDLPSLGASEVNYTWELLKPATGGGWELVGTAVTGTSAMTAVPDFTLPRTALASASGWIVRLTLTLTAPGPVPTAFGTSIGWSTTLFGPTPREIEKTGCENANGPCSLKTPSSVAGNDPSTWAYVWSVTGGATNPPGSTSAVYTPTFTEPGSYTVKVKVSNALGDAELTLPLTIAASACGPIPSSFNTGVGFIGSESTCGPLSTCKAGETLTFNIVPFGWQINSPACDTFSWDFGDGTSPSTEQSPTHAYASNNTYKVTLKMYRTGNTTPVTFTTDVKVGSTDPGPQPGNCPTMTANNVYASFNGPASGCGLLNPNCTNAETINFGVSTLGYNLGCASHTFSWNWGDGTPAGSGQNASHKFSTPGTYNVTLTVIRVGGTHTNTATVKISGGTGNSCPTMVAGSNVYMAMSGNQSGCSLVTPNCRTSETVTFQASQFGYNFECSPHTFSWNFGDNGTASTQQATHTYAQPGNYKVTLTITNQFQPAGVKVEQNIVVTPPPNSCPVITPGINVFIMYLGQQSQCTPVVGTCGDENIQFTASAFGYNFGCADHTFEWDFGDGSAKSTEQNPAHKYTRGGTFTVKLKVKNPYEEKVISQDIEVEITPKKKRGVRH